MSALLDVLPIGQSLLWTFAVVFFRIGAMMSVLPAFGEYSVPMRIRLAAGLAFTVIVAPTVSIPPEQSGSLATAALIGVESANGLFWGVLLRMMVHALQIAGTIAAQSTSLSQLFGGAAGADPQPVMGKLLVTAGLALACLSGLHVKLVAYMVHSYDLVPAGSLISASAVLDVGLGQVTDVFALGFTLAAPFVLGALVYNVTLGVINRAMPQLMVAFVGAPAITAGGMLLLMLVSPIALSIWSDRLNALLSGGLP